MASQATWNLLPNLPTTPDVQAEDTAAQAAGSLIFLGNGLLRPFRRDEKADFANASGEDLVRSAVGQVLGTRSSSAQAIGELPWRPEFGSLLYTLRHSNNNDALEQIAQSYVIDALRKWEPRVNVTGFGINRRESIVGGGDDILEVIVQYDIIDRNVSGNNVILGGQQSIIELKTGTQ